MLDTPFVALWESFGRGEVVAVIVVMLVAQLLLYTRVQAQRRSNLPPGPRPWPILGNLTALADAKPHHALQRLAAQFGPLMYLQLGYVPCVVVSTAEAARHLFRGPNDERLISRPKMTSLGIVSDDYKLMAYAPAPGELWHTLRKIGNTEFFSIKRTTFYRTMREEEIRHMMKTLLESNEGEAVDMRSWLFDLVSNMMMRMLINKRIFGTKGADPEQELLRSEFEHYIHEHHKCLMPNMISDFLPFLRFFSETLQGWRAYIQDHQEKSVEFGMKILEVEKHRQRAAERQNDDSYVPDFVDIMCTAPIDNGKVLSDRLITLQVLDFYLGGTDTTIATVEWAMAELVTHPNLMKRAQEELDSAVGVDRLVQESDIPNLPFLQAIVKETFRLHPVGPLGGPRESTEPVQALGYKIPAKTRIILNIYSIHRDPAVYECPDEFDPTRFLDRHRNVNQLAAFGSHELVPFGIGRRICPAFNLGNLMVHIMLANLVQGFDWALPDGKTIDKSEHLHGVTFSLQSNLLLIPTARHSILARAL